VAWIKKRTRRARDQDGKPILLLDKDGQPVLHTKGPAKGRPKFREEVWLGKDGKPRWVAQVYGGRDPNTGKVQFHTQSFLRKKDAEQWAEKQQTARREGTLVRPSRETFAAYLRHWLQGKEREVAAGALRQRTLADYTGVLERWVFRPPKDAPPVGNRRFDKLNATSLEALYNWMHAQGKSPRTIRGLHNVLRPALKAAARKGLIARNWAELVDVPRPKRRHGGDEGETTVHAMTREQAERFLAAARSDRYSALWHVLLLGGLRPGEAFGLKWSDVDFDEGRIRVVRSLCRVRGVKGWQLTPPKTKRARRTVPLPPLVMQELRTWRKQQVAERLKLGAEWQDHGFVFTAHNGAPLHGANLYGSSFRWVMAKAELGEWGPEPEKPRSGPTKRRPFHAAFRVYDLRHTCATLLLLAGESVKVVSERLGHASVTLTMDTYQHVLPTMQEAAADKLEAMFGTGTK
jgi:integrase